MSPGSLLDGRSSRVLFLVGVAAVVFGNVLLVASNYVIKLYRLPSSDMSFWRGVIAVIICTCTQFVTARLNKQKEDTNEQICKTEPASLAVSARVRYCVLLVFGVIAGLRLLTYYQALLLIPLAECIVLTSTTPVFSLVATRLLVGTRLKWTQLFYCLTVIIGVVFVVQPPFLTETFPGLARHDDVIDVRAINSNNSSVSSVSNVTKALNDDDGESDENPSETYVIGVVLALSYAAGCGFANVLPSKYSSIPTNTFILWGGLGAVVVSFAGPLMGMRLLLIDGIHNIDLFTWSLILSMALVSMMLNSIFVWALKLATPTAVAMVRRSDLVMVICVDAIIFSTVPSGLEWIGSVIVIASIVALTLDDVIKKQLSKLVSNPNSLQEAANV